MKWLVNIQRKPIFFLGNEGKRDFPKLEVDNNTSSSLPIYYIILASLIWFVAVFGNGVVIYIICTRRRLHVETNYFMVSLASADLLVGLFLPTFIIA